MTLPNELLDCKLPLRIMLPGMDVVLTERFLYGIRNRPPILHTHPCFELTCVEHPGGMKFVLTPPFTAHMAVEAPVDSICSFLFTLTQETVPKDICSNFRNLTNVVQIEDHFQGAQRINSIRATIDKPMPGYLEKIQAELRLLLVDLACSIFSNNQYVRAISPNLDEVRLALLEECFNTEFCNPDWSKTLLAERIGVSQRQLTRILAEKYHSTYSKLLLQVRMSLAKAMVQQGNYKLHEIASACGYRSVPVFRRAYKAYFGHLPSKNDTN